VSDAAPELLVTLGLVRASLAEAHVEHVFIGALPVLAWGRPRGTTDIDVVVFCEPAGFSRLEEALATRQIRAGQHIGPTEPGDALPDIAVFWLGPVRVDVFVAKMDFERAVLACAKTATVLDADLKLASCEASIIYKLLASRAKDIADVESMFEARAAIAETLDWEFLDRWASEWGISERLEPYRVKFRTGTP
jgi:hypothetical protein